MALLLAGGVRRAESLAHRRARFFPVRRESFGGEDSAARPARHEAGAQGAGVYRRVIVAGVADYGAASAKCAGHASVGYSCDKESGEVHFHELYMGLRKPTFC